MPGLTEHTRSGLDGFDHAVSLVEYRAGQILTKDASIDEFVELVGVLPPPRTAVRFGDDVKHQVHGVDPSFGADEGLLEIDVPAQLGSVGPP